MLVLSRSRGQAIVIGGGIVVDIVSICRGRVQIGITAPKNVSIHREEIQQRIDEQRRQVGAQHRVAYIDHRAKQGPPIARRAC